MKSTRRSSERQGAAFFKVLAFLVVLAIMVVVAWTVFLPPMLSSTLARRTDFTVQVQDLKMNPFSPHLVVNELSVAPQTAPFERRDFVHVRHLEAQGRLWQVLGERPVLDRVTIHIARLTFVRTKGGNVNAALFEARLNPPKDNAWPIETPTNPLPKEKKPSPSNIIPVETPEPFLIKRLELRIDRVVFADYSQGEPVVKEIKVDKTEVFENVSDARPIPSDFVRHGGLVPVGSIVKSLVPGGIGRAIHGATRGRFLPLPSGPNRATVDAFKSLSESLEESPKP